MGINLNLTQVDWTDGSGAKGNTKGQVSFSVLDRVLYIGIGDDVVEFIPIQNTFSGNYDDLNGLPNLDVFETTPELNDRDAANRNRNNHTGSQPISSVDGLQAALGASLQVLFAVNFSATGGVITIKSQKNVSGIVRTALGRYRIEYASNAPDENYLIFGFAGFHNNAQNPYMTGPQNTSLSDWKKVDSATIQYSYANVARNIDPDDISVMGVAL